jgi:hypothetical protein
MAQMIAFCGLICTDCPGYIATQAGDWAALEKLAEKARVDFNSPDATAASSLCDGCLSISDRKCAYCAECSIRACAFSRGVANCGACPDYGCEKISGFLNMVPEAKATLDSIHSAG